MAIVKMDKFTLLTFHRHKNSLLKELQKFGDVHFKKLRKDELVEMEFMRADFSPERTTAEENELENVRFAITKIAPYVQKPKGLKGLTAAPPRLSFEEFDAYLGSFDYKAVCAEVKRLDDHINSIQSGISKLASENDNLKTWLKLDVSPKELEGLKDARAVLGTINKMAADNFRVQVENDFPEVYLETLGVAKDDMAVLLILPEDGFDERFSSLKELGFSRVGFTFSDVPVDAVAKNKAKIESLQKERQDAENAIASFAPQFVKLNIVSDCFKTRLERERACENFLQTDSVVMLEGWVPGEERGRMNELLAKVCGGDYYLESSPADKDDPEIPVKLKNGKFARAFEDVTSMYATPKYGEIDPTPLLAPFYWFFFGFMVGDTGFGLVLMIGTFLALKFCSLKEGMRRFITFFFYCSFAVIIAGFVYGSFFGYPFFTIMTAVNAAGETVNKPILDTQLDIPLMLIISIFIGVIQVLFGLIVKGYLLIRDGHVIDAVFDSLFWIITLLGGILWLVGVTGAVPESAAVIGKWCFIGGIIGLALTQGRGSASIGGKIGTSLWEVYGISGYVGDLVSYTRIVALALSGSYIGFSFIKMASILPSGIIGVVFGTIIILAGQTLNFGLGLLGAYVHTCRLQYVEFFGKFYEGGGVSFKPLKCGNDYIEITK